MTDVPIAPLHRPLADILRPASLDDVIGQDHLVGPGGILRHMLEARHLTSHILWGPTGSGKTSIARHLAGAGGYVYMTLSAATAGVAAFREVVRGARQAAVKGKPTLLFVDECHRWSRSQQDVFLPYVEDGTVTLVGATTENPSYVVNHALLSRCRVFRLRPLGDGALEQLLKRAENLLERPLPLDSDARAMIRQMAGCDRRYLPNLVEDLLLLPSDAPWTAASLGEVLACRMPNFDKNGRMHHALISGLQKAIRGSNPDAALHWLARLLAAGKRLEVVARRLIATALEDVGMADPNALVQAISAKKAVEYLGPLGELALAQYIVYLSTAPKSNALSVALGRAREEAERTSHLPPRYTPSGGSGYRNDHDVADGFVAQNHLPRELIAQKFYRPVERGYERELIRRLEYWNRLRQQQTGEATTSSAAFYALELSQ